MRGFVNWLGFLVLLIHPAAAQEVVTDLSEYEIELTPSFAGQDLFLYGAVKNAGDLGQGRFDLVVVIQGEERAQVVRKKDRVFGFWLNTESRTIENVPDFYGQASTRPLDEIADKATLKNLGLGLDELPFVSASENDPAAAGFVQGLIRSKERQGLYQINSGNLEVNSDILFRADFFFPAKVPSGTYNSTAYLFHKGKLIGWSDKTIEVTQAGIERALYNLAHQNSAFYGIMAILIALTAGWLAGYITRGRVKLG